MDSKTTTPAAPDPLAAAMLHNATFHKAEKNEFNNSARDTIKFTMNNYNFSREGENLVLESSDVLDCLRNAVQPFLEEVRKNDQSRSTVANTTGADSSDQVPQAIITDHAVEGDPVKIIDLVPSEPSSLPVSSVADLYARSMLKCLAGYPLYEPEPLSEFSTEYLRHGVIIGDVGFVREDGIFDFLFNICLPKNDLINPPKLPDGFSLETAKHSETRAGRALSRKTCLFKPPVTKMDSGEYICDGSEGAVLELPEGGIKHEAMNTRPFEKLAARHGVQWYEHTMTRGRSISNGSLYLITSFTKCGQWGIAVFDRKCGPGQGLRFSKKRSLPFGKSTSKYHWKGSRAFPTKVSEHNQGDAPNQCVFLRGYKIMIRQDIFDTLCNSDQPHRSDPVIPSSSSKARSISMTRDRATRIRGGGGSDPLSKRLTDGGLLSWTKMSSMTKSDEVVLHANFSPSLAHPSDVINAALLSQNPGAKLALTHDDVWCNLLRDNFPKLNYTTLINTARSYTYTVDEYGCVTLKIISDSSSVLDESNRPLQGTEIPALQARLATPDDDYTPSLPVTISVTLPHDLLERILLLHLLLNTKSIPTCRLVNKEFNGIIQSSIELQYFLACKAAGVIDNPQSPLSFAERLEALKNREDAWRKLKPVFETTFSVLTNIRVCGPAEGVYFLSSNYQKDLNYCRLTSSPHDKLRWFRNPSHGPAPNWSGKFVDFVTALYEHDLIVNFINSSSGHSDQADMQRCSLDMVFLKFSTGEYHPFARHPRIHVQRSPDDMPRVYSGIAGDNLAVVTHSPDGIYSDKLFIFDWKTGCKLLQHEPAGSAYSNPVFLSPELLLVPNRVLSHFEVWHLPPNQHNPSTPIQQILSLQIPALSPDYEFINFACYGAPNPFPHTTPHLPPRPFFSSPENSIILVKLRMESSNGQRARYHFVMHRRALLDTIQKWTSPSFLGQQEDVLKSLTNEFTLHKIVDPEDGSVRLEAQSKLGSMIPDLRSSSGIRGSPTCPTSDISTDSGPLSVSSRLSISSTSRCTFLQVPWANWGPPISRWFQINLESYFWRSGGHFYGERYAFSDPHPCDPKKLMVGVADFNQYNVRKNAEMMARLRSGEGEDNSNNCNNEEGNEEEEEEIFEILDHEGVFSEEVYMGLKCVVYHAPDEYDFDLTYMDEQRLFGLKLTRQLRGVESMKVFYIG